MKEQILNLIAQYKINKAEYDTLVSQYEARGIENLSYEDTEDYGFYHGKSELAEQMINSLEKIIK